MKNSKRFEPLSIGKLHLKNRIAMAPMTRGRAGKERVPGDLMAEYYFQRAGAGLLITEAKWGTFVQKVLRVRDAQ
jgi:N-ethylmaleimide reductase